jgi:hypothetical protein
MNTTLRGEIMEYETAGGRMAREVLAVESEVKYGTISRIVNDTSYMPGAKVEHRLRAALKRLHERRLKAA